jgi:hypothetical protein
MMLFERSPASSRWSSSSLSSLSSNLSMYDQSPWKTLQMADIFDDDEHFKRKARRSVEDTDGIDGDIDSPISKTPPKTSVEGIILPSFNLGTVDEGEGFSRESIISEFQVVGDSNPPSRRTSVLSVSQPLSVTCHFQLVHCQPKLHTNRIQLLHNAIITGSVMLMCVFVRMFVSLGIRILVWASYRCCGVGYSLCTACLLCVVKSCVRDRREWIRGQFSVLG